MADYRDQVKAHIRELLTNEIARCTNEIDFQKQEAQTDRVVLRGRAAMQALPTYITDQDDTEFRVKTEMHLLGCMTKIGLETQLKSVWTFLLAYHNTMQFGLVESD